MKLFSLLFLFIVFTSSAQNLEQKDTRYPEIFVADGRGFGKILGKTNRPKIVIDTVRFANTNFASLYLNSFFTRGIHNVAASSSDNIFISVTQILDDSTSSLNTYAAMPTDNGRRILIKSSQSDDSGLVSIMLILN